MSGTKPQIRVGISGWTYEPWRGVFFPKDLIQKNELNYASRMLNSIEINGTFYSLQRPSTFQTWYDSTPADFMFSVKCPRYISHIRRLKDAEKPLANFFASGVFALKEKLGPMLWQLPPNFLFDADRLGAFFRLLPRDLAAASALAKQHEDRVNGRSLTTIDINRPIRYALEVRHISFAQPAFIDLLRKHNVALVIADTAGKWPYAEDLTADFAYLRLHGDEELYASGYSEPALARWAERLNLWKTGKQPPDAKCWGAGKSPKAGPRDLFVYFDNDVKVRAPFDAMSLAHRLGPTVRGEMYRANDIAPITPKIPKKAMAQRVRSYPPGVKRVTKQSKE